MKKNIANAVWHGSVKEGSGNLTTFSKSLKIVNILSKEDLIMRQEQIRMNC